MSGTRRVPSAICIVQVLFSPTMSPRRIKPRPHPQWARREGRVLKGLLVVWLSLWVIWIATGNSRRSISLALFLAALGSVLWFVLYLSRRAFAARRAVKPHLGFVCSQCYYPLTGLPHASNCPECSTPYVRRDLLEQWERYGVGIRLVRQWMFAPDQSELVQINSTTDHFAKVPNNPIVPWRNVSLATAITQIECAARRKGFSGLRVSSFRTGPADDFDHIPRPLPTTLDAFLGSFDASLWATFVGNAPRSLHDNITQDSDWFQTAGASPLPAITIYSYGGLFMWTLADAAELDPLIDEALSGLAGHPAELAWRGTRLLFFGNTASGWPLALAIEPPAIPSASVVTFLPGHRAPVHLADSLPEWLARLAACGGSEPVFDPEALKGIDPSLAAIIAAEHRERNPGSTLLSSAPS